MEFVLPAVAWRFQHFMQKHRKWTARLPLSAGCFLIAQAGIFICCTTTVGFFWGIIILLKSHVPCKPWFFLQSFANFATLIVIFENVSAKGFFWLNIKNFEISALTAHSRYLQTAALKHDSLLCLICAVMIMSASRKDFVRRENLIGQWANSY